MRDCGDERGYLTLYRTARWQPHLCPVTSQCCVKGRVALTLRKRPAANEIPEGSALPINRETVTFYEDKPVRVAGIPVEKVNLADLPKSLKEDRVHTLLDIMKRPIVLTDFIWASTSPSNSVLATIFNPNSLLTNPMLAPKISGFVGFKAKMIIRLQVNAQRFSQGRLLVHYFPLMASVGATRNTITMANLIFKTQLPRIDYDVATDTDVVLEMPFVYPYEYFPLQAKSPEIGEFFVSVYSPLVSSVGSSTAHCTVWGYFDDIELVYPTTLTPHIYEAQMARVGNGRNLVRDVPEAELASVGEGPVSAVFGRVSKAATILSEIPLLSSVASPVSWAAAIFGRAASAFGFSNPSSTEPFRKVLPARTAFMNNCNGVDNSCSFGLIADNHVQLLPGVGGTDIDEMSLSHIASIPSYLERFNWSDTDAVGVMLWSHRVSPSTFGQLVTGSTGSGTAGVFLPSPVAFIANFFNYWRGSLCFTFKAVKTEFHTGRLLFVWTPDNTVAPTYAETVGCYKEVLDLRGSNEFTVCIPYASIKPWNLTTQFTGYVSLYVLNPLVTANSASTIEILVEGAGGSDIEFAFPGNPINYPTVGVYAAQIDDGVWEAQMFGPAAVSNSSNAVSCPAPDCIASSTLDSGDMGPSSYCIGEKIISLRQLLKRSVPWLWEPSPAGISRRIKVFTGSIGFWNIGSAPYFNHPPDYWDTMCAMFALSRGGVRVKGWDTTDTVKNWFARLLFDPGNLSPFNIGAVGVPTFSNVIAVKTSMTGALEVEVPMYAVTHTRVNALLFDGQTITSSDLGDQESLEIKGAPWSGADIKWYRQGAEDTQFACFLSAIPLMNNGYITSLTSSNW